MGESEVHAAATGVPHLAVAGGGPFCTRAVRGPLPPPVRIQVPLPLPLRTANAWLFVSDARSALVDCGVGTPDGYEALRVALWDSGVDANGIQVFATHGHIDHVGNAARLRREFGAEVHAAEAERPLVERFRVDAEQRYAAWTDALRSHGVPDDVVARILSRARHLDALGEDVPRTSPLVDGQRVRLGDVGARVHAMPGHSPGSVAYETDDGDLLTGDTLLRHITSNAIELTDADRGRYATYLRTLDGLRRFVGMQALPGHHDPFPLTDAVLDEHLAKHRERSQRILERLDRPHAAWDLVGLVFPRLSGEQAFLGVCEVVGHLSALELDGRVAMRDDDGVRRFVRC
jgi:glyoxylase-like metal-dependent hydrolase (beta-lactamase superfamily II)